MREQSRLRSAVLLSVVLACSITASCSLLPGRRDGNPAVPSPTPAETEAANSRSENTPRPTVTPQPTPTPDPTEQKIKTILDSMTLQEKIGQLLLVGYPVSGEADKMIMEHKVGGIVLFSRNYNTFEELYAITKSLKQYNKDNPLPLWIALDEEGGTVSRLPKGKTPVPGARVIGSNDDIEVTKAAGRVIGEEMTAAGANLDFAPVLDIVRDPENKLLFKRSFGDTPDMVSAHGTAFLEGLSDAGVIGCAKHFPGHGDTIVDSHKGMPVIEKTLEEWRNHDAVPFKRLIDAGVDMVMVGHLAFPNIDPTGLPASESKVFMTDILREEMGFKGLVITDDIEMLGYPQGDAMNEAVVTSFLAGVDIFVIGHTPEVQLRVLNALKEAVDTGRITEDRISESVMRIIRIKLKLENIPEYTFEEAEKIFGSSEHYDAVADIIK